MSPKHVIYKKLSRDKSVGVYMEKRDFVDHCEFVDPVDGVVLIDPEQVKGKKVYVMLSCMFRYGRDDMDVLGMSKVFVFVQRCAMEFEVKAFCAENQDEKAQKRSSVRLAIRKIQYAPDKGGAAPSAETTCEFIMSDKPLHMRVSLEKETYYHGEEINISVDVDNSSNRNMKDLSVSVEQVTNVVLYSNDKYVKTVAYEETTDTVPSGTSLKKVYTLCPLLDNNRERLGLALDGKLKHEDTNLASSSIVKDEVLKEILGMLVAYRVVVKSNAAGIIGSSEVAVEVPFKLMHPKPDPESEDTTDLVFEEFKRSYLKGVIGDDDESPAEP
ncbi:S-arrestin-like [Sinocyclocheilus grahami]|uniref:S-arrestin-like n=1 Tax=Sinocyclocheilus grahami TaxID=75366 RepID=UPI0007ACC7E9|nr:PREDICTED: S-arrestin-like [Sinocyclocheilus grahami]